MFYNAHWRYLPPPFSAGRMRGEYEKKEVKKRNVNLLLYIYIKGKFELAKRIVQNTNHNAHTNLQVYRRKKGHFSSITFL